MNTSRFIFVYPVYIAAYDCSKGWQEVSRLHRGVSWFSLSRTDALLAHLEVDWIVPCASSSPISRHLVAAAAEQLQKALSPNSFTRARRQREPRAAVHKNVTLDSQKAAGRGYNYGRVADAKARELTTEKDQPEVVDLRDATPITTPSADHRCSPLRDVLAAD